MENATTKMSQENAERLATSAIQQFCYRLGIKKEDQIHVFNKSKFYDFFISLAIPANPASGLVLSEHSRPYDFPKDHMQYHEIRNPAPMANLEVYPRGIIISSKVEEDLARSQKRPFPDKVRAEIIRLNQRYGPKIAPLFGKQGKHIFPSGIAYMKLLRDREISALLVDEAKREPYFGFVRVDYSHLKPRNNEPGWLKAKEVLWMKSFPVVIIPGITEEKLEVMVEKERRLLGIS